MTYGTDARVVADLMVAGHLGCLGDRAYCDKELTLIVRRSSQCTFIVPQEYKKYFEKYEKKFPEKFNSKKLHGEVYYIATEKAAKGLAGLLNEIDAVIFFE